MKTIGWIIAIPFILLTLFVVARFLFCGPDREVIKVAKPVVQIIADDIVKNGIPESLADIEGLPYVLEECSKEIDQIRLFEEESYKKIIESCVFKNGNKQYRIEMNFGKYVNFDGRILISSEYTHVGIDFITNKNQIFIDGAVWTSALYHGVLCGSFKQ